MSGTLTGPTLCARCFQQDGAKRMEILGETLIARGVPRGTATPGIETLGLDLPISRCCPLFLSTYPPTACGIATFTRDLANAVDLAAGEPVSSVAAIRTAGEINPGGARVVHVVDDSEKGSDIPSLRRRLPVTARKVAGRMSWQEVGNQYHALFSQTAERDSWGELRLRRNCRQLEAGVLDASRSEGRSDTIDGCRE